MDKETKHPSIIEIVGFTIIGTIAASAIVPAIITNTKIAVLIPFSVFMIGCVMCHLELLKVIEGYENTP